MCVFAAALAPPARAGTVTVTITGHVSSGTDGNTSAQGLVFGTAYNISGDAYTLTFTFDDSQGTETGIACGAPSYSLGYSTISNSGTSNPGTATLAIGSGSFTFDGVSMQQNSITSSVSYSYGVNCYGWSWGDYGVSVGYGTGYSASSSVQANIYPSSTVVYENYLGTNGDWRSTIATISSLYSGTFPYSIYVVTSPGGVPYQLSSGDLTPETFTVNGFYEKPDHESNEWINFDAIDTALGDWQVTLEHTNSNNTIPFTGLIRERSPYPGTDTCWHSGSPFEKFVNVTNPLNIPLNDSEYADQVGWVGIPTGSPGNPIDYYRAHPPAGGFPCTSTVHQYMEYQTLDGNWHHYGSNETGGPNKNKSIIYTSPNQVSSSRAAATEEDTSR